MGGVAGQHKWARAPGPLCYPVVWPQFHTKTSFQAIPKIIV